MTNLKDDISRLRQIATDAAGKYGDRGWKFECFGDEDYPQRVYVDGPAAIVCEVFEGGGNPTIAKHIACFDPPTIHGLLGEIEELQGECDRLGQENESLHQAIDTIADHGSLRGAL